MEKLNSFFRRIKPYFKGGYKYVFILVGFGVYFTFFDSFNFIKNFSNIQKIKSLESDIEYYNSEIETSKKQMEELQSDNKNLQKFAREVYLMKEKDEDIFVVDEK